MRPDAARVLVVEDEGVLRRSVADALAGVGFTVAALSDGRDFAAHVARFRPDVALLDVMLPGRSGLALADHLRRNTQTAVVFVTARDSVTDRLAGFDAGADDYLVKPFVIEELLARVRAVLRRSGRRSRRPSRSPTSSSTSPRRSSGCWRISYAIAAGC